MKVLVPGGAGFIGSNFVHLCLQTRPDIEITVVDKLTYAGNLASLADIADRITFQQGDIAEPGLIDALVADADLVVNFAAESHNDNALRVPGPFVATNLVGTFQLLEAVRRHKVRLHHISTDEVYGDTASQSTLRFTPKTPYNPSSPYAATKAGADMLVRAWVRSFGVRATISNCSNNYGPFQHVEKFIPRTITNLLDGGHAVLYGDGGNVRDWIHVDDHNRAVWAVLDGGRQGETYLIGASNEMTNRAVAGLILNLMGHDGDEVIQVIDRAGHDRRYAIDPSKLEEETGWRPEITDFRAGLQATIEWYKANEAWWRPQKGVTEARYATPPADDSG